MSYELSEQQVEELLHAYVLGALEPEEMLAMDDYIQRQREMLSQLEALEQTVALLAHGAPSHPLPQETKGRLMARIRGDVAQREPSPLVALRDYLARQWQLLSASPALAATLVLLLALSGFALWQGSSRNSEIERMAQQVSQVQAELTTLQAAATQLEEENQQLRQRVGEQEDRLAFFSEARPILIAGTEAAPGASGIFYRGAEEGLFVWQDLAPLSDAQAYQLWLIPPDGNPVSAGLLPRDGNRVQIELPAGQEIGAIGVSVEPADGSPAPTGEIVLLGTTG